MITKINAFKGLTIRISSAPITQPMKAPTIGINAVNAMSTAISMAYGIRSTDIATKNISPRMQASRHWPEINREKVLLERLQTYSIFCAVVSLNRA